MTAMEANDPAPDWGVLEGELQCPLCQYNLRGLEQSRCPECGFAFSWSEILRGQREKHPYLFEHQNKRNIWSFWKTYWMDCRPQRFWNELNPAQSVNLRRLMIYWFVASLPMFASPLMQFGFKVWDAFQTASRYTYLVPRIGPMPPFPHRTPPPPTFMDCVQWVWDGLGGDIREYPIITGSLTVLVWPWLTLLCLLIFSESMRRAKIQKRHVLRVVIYGTDFGFLLMILLCLGKDFRFQSPWPIFIAVVCSVLTLYRVYFGYARYLRFHLPFWTVLSSQIMVLLVFMIVYLRISLNW